MKKLLLAIILLSIMSCLHRKKEIDIENTIITSYNDSISTLHFNWSKLNNDTLRDDTVIIYPWIFRQPEVKRYWLIAYETALKLDKQPIRGNIAYISKGFFNKEDLDEEIYKSLEYTKESYQYILILNIYEMHSDEYKSYTSKSNKSKIKKIKKKKGIKITENVWIDNGPPIDIAEMYRRIDSLIKLLDTIPLDYN